MDCARPHATSTLRMLPSRELPAAPHTVCALATTTPPAPQPRSCYCIPLKHVPGGRGAQRPASRHARTSASRQAQLCPPLSRAALNGTPPLPSCQPAPNTPAASPALPSLTASCHQPATATAAPVRPPAPTEHVQQRLLHRLSLGIPAGPVVASATSFFRHVDVLRVEQVPYVACLDAVDDPAGAPAGVHI